MYDILGFILLRGDKDEVLFLYLPRNTFEFSVIEGRLSFFFFLAEQCRAFKVISVYKRAVHSLGESRNKKKYDRSEIEKPASP